VSPGIGIQSAHMICEARNFSRLNTNHLKKIGVALNKAKYFITTSDVKYLKDYQPMQIKEFILNEGKSKYQPNCSQQLKIF
jgi:predicted DNA-binding helix-hairpin-helix protein